jgi:periplasmic copper chaperone A
MRLLRRLGASSLAVMAAGAVLLVVAPAASAHVTVNPKTQVPGSFGEITFRAPNESADARFTKLVVHLPAAQPFGSLNARTLTGWQVATATGKLPKPITTDDGTTTQYTSEVTWTATGTAGGIPPEQYQDFDLSVGPFPAKGTMTFTVDQYYSDGSVVHWNQLTAPGGQEPEHPAPVLTLAAASAPGSSDGLARGFAIAAFVIAVIALLNTIVVRSRKRSGSRGSGPKPSGSKAGDTSRQDSSL